MLRADQRAVLEKAWDDCKPVCSVLHPIDEQASGACIEQCRGKHRELLEMENTSSVAAGVAVALLVGAIVAALLLRHP
jgi:hypothetical protein